MSVPRSTRFWVWSPGPQAYETPKAPYGNKVSDKRELLDACQCQCCRIFLSSIRRVLSLTEMRPVRSMLGNRHFDPVGRRMSRVMALEPFFHHDGLELRPQKVGRYTLIYTYDVTSSTTFKANTGHPRAHISRQ